jgi:ABC-2 type transport system ATP-binding protein
LIAHLRGKLWTTLVARDEAEQLRKQHAVLSCRLRSGRVEVRVMASEQPAAMVAATPDLEDVYFATLYQCGLAAHLE